MKISDLFEVKYGVNMELSNCEIVDNNDENGINFVARTASNNGVVAKVARNTTLSCGKHGCSWDAHSS